MSTTQKKTNEFDEQAYGHRQQIKVVAESVRDLLLAANLPGYVSDCHDLPELQDNLKLAYRHLEDARMRLGKAVQARDGGSSVYDR